MAWGCVLLLVACGATRSAHISPDGDELSRVVLVIQETLDGQPAHGWETCKWGPS
jgi:hypothetical protein